MMCYMGQGEKRYRDSNIGGKVGATVDRDCT